MTDNPTNGEAQVTTAENAQMAATTAAPAPLPFVVTHRFPRLRRTDVEKDFPPMGGALLDLRLISGKSKVDLVSTWISREQYEARQAEYEAWLIARADSPLPPGRTGYLRQAAKPPAKKPAGIWSNITSYFSWWSLIVHLVAVFGTIEAVRNHLGWTVAPAYVAQASGQKPHNRLIGEDWDDEVVVKLQNTSTMTTCSIDVSSVEVTPSDGVELVTVPVTFPVVKPGETVALPVFATATRPGTYRIAVTGSAQGGLLSWPRNFTWEETVRVWSDAAAEENNAKVEKFVQRPEGGYAEVLIPVKIGKAIAVEGAVFFRRCGQTQITYVSMEGMVSAPEPEFQPASGKESASARWKTGALRPATEGFIKVSLLCDKSYSRADLEEKLKSRNHFSVIVEETRP